MRIVRTLAISLLAVGPVVAFFGCEGSEEAPPNQTALASSETKATEADTTAAPQAGRRSVRAKHLHRCMVPPVRTWRRVPRPREKK